MGISIGGSRRALMLAALATLLPVGGVAQSQAAATRTTCSAADLHNDPRLGPKRLPNAGPLATVLKGYERLAGLSSKKDPPTHHHPPRKTWADPARGGPPL